MGTQARLDAVQILRAAAALAVALSHAGINLSYWGNVSAPWTGRGNLGVDLFFVISGFIVVYICFGEARATIRPGAFLLRRVLRIVPLYWLVTTVYVLSGNYPFGRIVDSYFFLPRSELPVVTVGWSLNYEMLFYAMFALLLFLERRMAVLALVAALGAMVLAGVPFYGDPIVLEFGLGSLIGLLYVEGVRLQRWSALALMAGGAVLLGTLEPSLHRLIVWGLPAAAIVAGAVLGMPGNLGRHAAPLVLIGDASYALYLTHMPVVRLVATAMRDSGVDLAAWQSVFIIVACAASIGVAIAVHRYVERPLTDLLRGLVDRRRAAAASMA